MDDFQRRVHLRVRYHQRRRQTDDVAVRGLGEQACAARQTHNRDTFETKYPNFTQFGHADADIPSELAGRVPLLGLRFLRVLFIRMSEVIRAADN